MKKALVVLLAVAMIFCFAATAMAATYTDMADQTEAAQDAVAFNSALGIIAGYSDGTYGPEKNITRAEFAKIAVNAAGLADSADYLANTASKFSDVKVGAWYTGYINLAQSQGYLAGYPDGTFRPNATITNQEVVTVLLRMLGYSDNLTGPWPVDYINQAVKLDLLDDVNFVGAVPATRADVAIVAKATLDQELMKWSKDTETFIEDDEDATTDNTLLMDAFGADVVESDEFVAGLDGTTTLLTLSDAFTYDADDAELTLNATTGYVITADTFISDGLTFDQLAGHKVDLVLNNPGEKDETVAYIDVTSYVKVVDEVTDTTDLAAAGKIELDDKNYDVVSAPDYDADYFTAATEGNLYVYAFFNNDDEVYAVVADTDITAADELGVIEEVTAKGNFECYYEAGTLTTVDDEADVMIIKDGAAATLADIKEYDVVKEYNAGTDLVFFVSSMAAGTLDRVYTANTTIEGVKYANDVAFDAIDADAETVSLNDYIGEEVQYVLNANNELLFVFCGEAVESNTVKGIVVDYTTSDSSAYAPGGELDTITVVNQKGEAVKYTVDDDEYVLATETTYTGGVADAGTFISDVTAVDGDEITIGSYVEFTVDEDNVIKTAQTPATERADDEASYVIDDTYNRITINSVKYNVPSDALIFNLYLNDDDELEVEVLDRADIIDGDTLDVDAAFAVDAFADFIPTNSLVALVDGTVIETLVLMDANATSSAKYAMVDDEGWTNADGDDMATFYGDTAEYIVDASGDAAAEDTFYSYTISDDTVTLTEVAAFAEFDAATVTITSVEEGLVTLSAAIGGKTQGELTEDTVVLNIVLTTTAVDEVNVWDSADVDVEAGQTVLWAVNTDGEIEYILIIE